MVFKKQLLLLLHPTEFHSQAFIKTSRKVYFVGYISQNRILGLYYILLFNIPHCFFAFLLWATPNCQLSPSHTQQDEIRKHRARGQPGGLFTLFTSSFLLLIQHMLEKPCQL